MVDPAAMHSAFPPFRRLTKQRRGEVAAKLREGRNFLNFASARRAFR